MKRYAIFEYLEGGTVEGDVVAYVEAEDPFTACEQAGFPNQETHFARLVGETSKESDQIQKDEMRIKKIRGQLQEWIDADTKEMEKFKEDRPCPNCGKKMEKDYTCKSCGYGIDEIAIGGTVVTKKQLDKFMKDAKAAKKAAKKTK